MTADEFAIRYYRWALDDARREVADDFPLLRSVKSGLVMRAVGYLESLPAADRLRAATSLVKRNHRTAVELAGDSWGAEDRAIDEAYRNAVRTPRLDEAWHDDALLHDPARLRLDRRRFLAEVKAALAPTLGAGEPLSTKDEWRYETPLGPWRLVTFVDVGGEQHQLAYTDTIRVNPARVLKEGLSICGWLGIGGGHTTWDRLTEADTAAAAQSLARLCAHFRRAAPALVAGLSPE